MNKQAQKKENPPIRKPKELELTEGKYKVTCHIDDSRRSQKLVDRKNELFTYEGLIEAFPWAKHLPWDFINLDLKVERYRVQITRIE